MQRRRTCSGRRTSKWRPKPRNMMACEQCVPLFFFNGAVPRRRAYPDRRFSKWPFAPPTNMRQLHMHNAFLCFSTDPVQRRRENPDRRTSSGHPGHGRLWVGSGYGKQPVYLTLHFRHRLRHGRVVQREEAADREACIADKSFVCGVRQRNPGSKPRRLGKNTRVTVA